MRAAESAAVWPSPWREAGASFALVGRDEAALGETSRAVAATATARPRRVRADVTSPKASRPPSRSRGQASSASIDTAWCQCRCPEPASRSSRPPPTSGAQCIGTNLEGALTTIAAVGRHMVERKSGSHHRDGLDLQFRGRSRKHPLLLDQGRPDAVRRARSRSSGLATTCVLNSICPGWIETDLTAPYMQLTKRSSMPALRNIPLRRFGRAGRHRRRWPSTSRRTRRPPT